jgi:hypothetical protein
MTSEIEKLVLRDLYNDALSGKFLPLTDPAKRLHTVARLAVATCHKGSAIGSDGTAFSYEPSWANGSQAFVHMFKSGRPRSVALAGADYAPDTDPADPVGFARFMAVSRGRELVIQDSTGIEVIGALAVGADLDRLQQTAAHVAESFYFRLHQRQSAAD